MNMVEPALISAWTSPSTCLASVEDRERFLRRPIARAVLQGRTGDASAEQGARAFLSHLQVARRLEHHAGDSTLVSMNTLALYIRSHSESCVGVFPPPLGRDKEQVLLNASFGAVQEYDADGMLLPPCSIPETLSAGTKDSAVRLGAITCVLFEQGRLGAAAAFGGACIRVCSLQVSMSDLERTISRIALAASLRSGSEIGVDIDVESDSYLQILSGKPPRFSSDDTKAYTLLGYLYSLSVARSDTGSGTGYGEVALTTLTEIRSELMGWLPPLIRRFTAWKLDPGMLEDDVATLAKTHNTCAGCGTEQLYLSKCGGCKRAWFCSTACHRMSWPEHKAVCRRYDH